LGVRIADDERSAPSAGGAVDADDNESSDKDSVFIDDDEFFDVDDIEWYLTRRAESGAPIVTLPNALRLCNRPSEPVRVVLCT
jgi:hypothetical protein